MEVRKLLPMGRGISFDRLTRALKDAFGVEMLAPGELDLAAGCVERARAERGEAPLAD
ncbi:hypothetical protein [Collinsella stercoris]|uniref:hypothetical protein n=1 Tax=Collinsella stercoris TaxID=147206 RepID=UPI00248DE5B1|nr:hypothetical protein [Collinsella stercoris]